VGGRSQCDGVRHNGITVRDAVGHQIEQIEFRRGY
jgi:hypothetical protein